MIPIPLLWSFLSPPELTPFSQKVKRNLKLKAVFNATEYPPEGKEAIKKKKKKKKVSKKMRKDRRAETAAATEEPLQLQQRREFTPHFRQRCEKVASVGSLSEDL